jgi:glycerol-3-phosphate dehydrogenase
VETKDAQARRDVDLLVIGGGVNGCGIARDAAGRGLSVLLCEQGDLAGATSQASSKLVHGGLRYLEHGEFRLVREALAEREVLLASAPHLVRPLRFVLPHHAGLRPTWMLRLGLLIYDHLGGRRSLAPTRGLDLRREPAGAPLKPGYVRGFEYADCRVDDARLTVLLALDAAERGASVLTRTRFERAEREGEVWRATLTPPDGGRLTVRARALVNAAGPWVVEAHARCGLGPGRTKVRLVKGSHVVIPRLYDGPQAYTLQSGDGRVVFAIPFEDDFTLVGTTDVPFEGDPAAVSASSEEVAYLLGVLAGYFRREVSAGEVVWAYAGVRPLHDDGRKDASAVTRDYVFDLDAGPGRAPVLSVYGGKITTFRRLAEHALDDLARVLPIPGRHWTASATLPGGDIPDGFEAFLAEARRAWPWLEPRVTARLCRAYGARIEAVLDGARRPADLGEDLGAGLTERELDWLRDREWARTAEDVLWRRSKLGLFMTRPQREALARRMATLPPLRGTGLSGVGSPP